MWVASLASQMTKTERPNKPIIMGTRVCQLDQAYMTPPQVMAMRKDVDEPRKMTEPT